MNEIPTRLILTLSLIAAGAGCEADAAPEPVAARSEQAAATFGVAPLTDLQPLELRGEGSEFLRAPADARVRPLPAGAVRVEGGNRYRIQVGWESPALAVLAAGLPKEDIVLRSDDAVLVRSGSGFAFAVVRELVPEWDESDRRRISCSTPDLLSAPERVQPVSREQASLLVAACRTMSLPSLR